MPPPPSAQELKTGVRTPQRLNTLDEKGSKGVTRYRAEEADSEETSKHLSPSTPRDDAYSKLTLLPQQDGAQREPARFSTALQKHTG